MLEMNAGTLQTQIVPTSVGINLYATLRAAGNPKPPLEQIKTQINESQKSTRSI